MEAQLQQIEDNTCVKFVRRSIERDYVVIGNYNGCSSPIGRNGGRQNISMSYNRERRTTCLWGPTMMHEMMHSLGIHHMHNSIDRDDYITVHLEIVAASSHRNFNLVSSTTTNSLGTPYDLRSATHYANWQFSSNGGDVLVPHDPEYLLLIGRLKVLSTGDIIRINRMHSCSAI